MSKRTSVNQLFATDLKVVNFGLSSFKDALSASGAQAVQVDWKPPVDVDVKASRAIAARRAAIEKANRKALEIILGGMPHLVGMERAIDIIPGMKRDLILHAGPPRHGTDAG